MRMKLNRKYILSRGQIFVGMSIGMLLGFTPQFWAPWPKDSGIFYLQSIGFGLLLAAYTLFTGYVFQGILAKSKSITKQDIYIFWACLPFVIEPPRVSRRPNFLREYPNEKYLLT